MAFTAGVFTPSAIADIVIAEQDLLATSRMSELSQEIVAGQALLQHQDPNIVTLGEGSSCFGAKVYTLRSASLEAANTTLACAIPAGPKAGTEAISLTKTLLTKPQRFAIDDVLCRNDVDFVKQMAYLGMKAKVGLEVALSKAIVTLAGTGADTPEADWFETAGTVSGTDYEIDAADFDADVLADLQWAGKASDMNQPIIINGRNFFNKSIIEQYASVGCCTNDAILNRNQVFDIYWDAKNVDSTLGAGSTLVVDKNSVLFWSSHVYDNMGMETMTTEGEESNDRFHFVDTLPRLKYFANGGLQDIYVDVRVEKGCVLDSLNVSRTAWKFEYMLFGAMSLNLANQDGYNGILSIKKVTGA